MINNAGKLIFFVIVLVVVVDTWRLLLMVKKKKDKELRGPGGECVADLWMRGKERGEVSGFWWKG